MKAKYILLLAAVLAAGTLHADWTQQHRDASQNRYVPVPGFGDVTGTPALVTSGAGLTGSTPVLISGSTAYTLVRTSGPDTCRVIATELETGNPLAGYTPADLDTAISFSLSSPTIEGGDLYIGTGTTVYRLNGTSGSTVWSTVLSASNSDPSVDAQYAIVNSSVAVGTSNVLVQTYDSSFTAPYNKSQLVALNRATGTVAWFVKSGGIGTASPMLHDAGGTEIVIVQVEQAGGGGMRAFNADTGAAVWDSATVTTPWSTTNLVWTDAIIVAGKLYAVTYNFSGTNGQLVRVDASTGALEYAVPSITADCPPVLAGGNIYLLGGPFGSPLLTSHVEANGAAGFSVAAPASGGIFRNYLTATDSYLYFSRGGDGLRVVDISNGALVSTSAATNLNSPPTIDASGRIHVRGGGERYIFDATSNVSDWIAF
jgi:hypothetical protein